VRLAPRSRIRPGRARRARRTLASTAASLGVAAVLLTPAGSSSGAAPLTRLAPVAAAPAASALPAQAAARADRRHPCTEGKRFRPTSLEIPGLTQPRAVLALGRGPGNVPKAPPLSEAGKRQFAWDAKDAIRAGARRGIVKLNAHTYPDGSAMGNTLINGLYAGDRIVVRGAEGQQRCYEVIARVQITAERRYARYYRTEGRPGRLGIAVCSGVRRGPGDWSHRTIWFAKLLR
jgi:hypothetical protein